MNGREQSFAWAKLADRTVGRDVRAVVVPLALPEEGFGRQEPMIVPWPTRGLYVSETGSGMRREARAK
jgi:hypothetical protein